MNVWESRAESEGLIDDIRNLMQQDDWKAKSCATFFRHSVVLSVAAVLLRKVPIVEYEAKEWNECPSQFVAEIRKSDDLKILSLNVFILLAFNDLNWFSQKTVNFFFSLA